MSQLSVPETKTRVFATLTARLPGKATLDAIRLIKGVKVDIIGREIPQARFAYEVRLGIESRTGLAALKEAQGLKVVSAALDVPTKSRKNNRWGDPWWISLRGREEALRAETELEGLLSAGRITPETAEQAKWMLQGLVWLLRTA